MNAVVESVRNIVAVGAIPLAITDCLCFGNPEKPEQMGEFVESVRGIVDACRAISIRDCGKGSSLPVIAGNVSFYNESPQGAIPPSPMISCVGAMPEVSKAITYDLKRKDTLLFMIGERKDECGGSVYYQLYDGLGSQLPKPDLSQLNKEIQTLHTAIQKDLILSAHDISEGGVACALAEMTFKQQIGIRVDVPGDLPVEKKLFSETGGFILEVSNIVQ